DLDGFTTDARHGSPDLAQDLAADAALARFAVGHDPLRRGQDGDAEAVADLRDLAGGDVGALAGTRHAAQAGDRGAGATVVAQGQRDAALVLVVVAGRHAVEVALVAEDLRESELDGGARAVDGLLA